MGQFVVVQAGPTQLLFFQGKTQWFDQMQMRPGVGGQADDIAGIGRDFRFEQCDMEHGDLFQVCTQWRRRTFFAGA